MSNNCTPSYYGQPFMFGGHPPGARSASLSQSNFVYGRTDSVRDCLSWTNSLPAELQGNSNYNWGNAAGAAQQYTYTMPVQPQQVASPNRPAPAGPMAFMSIPGQGGKGDLQPISIPIQVGTSGSKLGPLPSMEPLVINASAPMNGNGVTEPFCFKITADQYYGGGGRH